jgi:hypothetical protein
MSNQVSFESWLQNWEMNWELERFIRVKKRTLSLALADKLATPLRLRSHQQFRSRQSPVAVGQSAGKICDINIIENIKRSSIFEFGNNGVEQL